MLPVTKVLIFSLFDMWVTKLNLHKYIYTHASKYPKPYSRTPGKMIACRSFDMWVTKLNLHKYIYTNASKYPKLYSRTSGKMIACRRTILGSCQIWLSKLTWLSIHFRPTAVVHSFFDALLTQSRLYNSSRAFFISNTLSLLLSTEKISPWELTFGWLFSRVSNQPLPDLCIEKRTK